MDCGGHNLIKIDIGPPRMALYEAVVSTTMKVTDTTMLFHHSPNITGMIMALGGYVFLIAKPMMGKSTRFKSFLDLPIFS